MKKVVFASNNHGKIKELTESLKDFKIALYSQADFKIEPIEETGLTFVENALLKARQAAKITQLPAIGDDSGLEVEALLGQPGIYSARFAGKDASDQQNIAKLLEQLQGVPTALRQCNYHCVLVYLRHFADPKPIICQGSWPGLITDTPYGVGGFGYDSIFFVNQYQCTAAELPTALKNSISHRALALKELVQALKHDWIVA